MLCAINYKLKCLMNPAINIRREESKVGTLPKQRTFATIGNLPVVSLMRYELGVVRFSNFS